ncbi:unnamed protein product, partial [marine sediment metagenome]
MADNVRKLIQDMQKPLEGQVLKKSSMMADLMDTVTTLSDQQKKESDILKKGLDGLKKESPLEPLQREPKSEQFPPLSPAQEQEQESEQREEEEDSEERNSLLGGLINAVKEDAQVGAKIAAGVAPIAGQVSSLESSMSDALLGPLSGIANSSKEMALNTLIELKNFAQERLAKAVVFFKERREAKKQLIATRKVG